MDKRMEKERKIMNISILIMRMSVYIAYLENWKKVFPEMVDDAVYVIFKKKIITILPNEKLIYLNKFTFELRSVFSKINSYQKDNDGASRKIACFIYQLLQKEKEFNIIYKKSKPFIAHYNKNGNFIDMNPPIILPKGRKWYRKYT